MKPHLVPKPERMPTAADVLGAAIFILAMIAVLAVILWEMPG